MLSHQEVTVSLFRSPAEFTDFQCEKQEYCDFVQNPKEALKYYLDNLGVTYVFHHKGKPIGFVTLAMSSLRKRSLPEERQKQKPFRHVPSLLLGHMARDTRYKGKGVGRIMMDFVLAMAYQLGKNVGCRFVILDCEADMVSRYRRDYGFQLVPPSKHDRLFVMFFDLGLRK